MGASAATPQGPASSQSGAVNGACATPRVDLRSRAWRDASSRGRTRASPSLASATAVTEIETRVRDYANRAAREVGDGPGRDAHGRGDGRGIPGATEPPLQATHSPNRHQKVAWAGKMSQNGVQDLIRVFDLRQPLVLRRGSCFGAPALSPRRGLAGSSSSGR